jgi:hypothetical protein
MLPALSASSGKFSIRLVPNMLRKCCPFKLLIN